MKKEEKTTGKTVSFSTLVFSIIIAAALSSIVTLAIKGLIDRAEINSIARPSGDAKDGVPPLPPCKLAEIGVIDDCMATEMGGQTFNLGDQFILSLEKVEGAAYSDPSFDKEVLSLVKHVNRGADNREHWVFLTKSVGNSKLSVQLTVDGENQDYINTIIQVDAKVEGIPAIVPLMPVETEAI